MSGAQTDQTRLPPPPFWRTVYFDTKVRLRPDRSAISPENIIAAIKHPAKTAAQPDGRLRYWYFVPERGKWLRVILESDRETVHNAFWDRRFKI